MEKYVESESHDMFWQWLWSVAFQYQTTLLRGPDRDEERVLILGTLLEGKAKEWFQDQMSKLGGSRPTFVDVIIDMYKRFIIKSAQQDARDAFNDAKWTDAREQVQGWHDLLMRWVEDMDIAPDAYTVNEKFLGELPGGMRTHVLADKLSMEYNMLDELVEAVLDAEYTLRMK